LFQSIIEPMSSWIIRNSVLGMTLLTVRSIGNTNAR